MWSRRGRLPDNIRFINDAKAATFRDIDIKIKPPKDNNDLMVSIYVSYAHRDVQRTCRQELKEHLKNPTFADLTVRINSEKSLNKLIEVLKKNDKTQDCTPALIFEIEQAFKAYQDKNHSYKHIIPKKTVTTIAKAQINPEKKDSLALFELADELSLKKLNNLLVSGENPNKRNHNGQSILFLLIDNQKLKVAKEDGKPYNAIALAAFLLICYGADFLDPNNGNAFHHWNSLELCLRWKPWGARYPACLKVMYDAMDYKTAQDLIRSSLKQKVKVKQIDVIREDKEILTIHLKLTNHADLRARLIRMNELTPAARIQCYKLFMKYFNDHEEFENVFSPIEANGVLLNLIYLKTADNQERLVGFNVFETVYFDNNISWHSWYTAMEPECRGPFAPIFAYAFAHATKPKYSNMDVDVYYNPIKYNALSAMGVATEIAAAPKHQSPHIVSLVDKIHARLRIYKNGVTVVHEGMTWCVKVDKPVTVQQGSTSTQNIMERLFEDHFKVPNSEPIAFYYISDQSVEQFYLCANSVGIDTTYLLRAVGHYLEPYLTDLTKTPCTNEHTGKNLIDAYPDGLELTFTKRQVKSQKKIEFKPPEFRASL